MELLVLVIALVALDLLSLRFGYDSRDLFGKVAHGVGASVMGWSDATYERELAHQILEARQRRLPCSQTANIPNDQVHDDLAPAA